MNKQIILRNETVAYRLKKNARARRMRLTVHCDGSVVITTPYGFYEALAERFIREKADWLISKIAAYKNIAPVVRRGRADYLKNKEAARELIEERAGYFAEKLGLEYNRISIRNQKTCWGSCSRRKNLNFNYKILFLSEKAQDYIIVHELCHLKEFNHSKKFWALVAGLAPGYKEIRKELRGSKIGFI